MIDERIKQMIRDKFNAQLKYPQQCEALSMSIYETTGQTLGTTTLKRMLGFVGGVTGARTSSLDIIANYLGYPNYELLQKEIGGSADISDYGNVESIDSADLEAGEMIKVAYEPKRELTLRYLGENKYELCESVGSKLMKNDILMISGFYIGFELLISDVERNGVHLGPYQAAKQGGLTDVEILR